MADKKTKALTRESFIKILRTGEINFDGAKFEWGAHLCNMRLDGISLRGSNLSHICLYNANLTGADLRNASLFGSYMWRTNFTGANLAGATLSHSDMRHAVLTDAKISGASLCGTRLKFATGTKSCDFNRTYFAETVVTAQQSRNIMGRYELVREPVRSREGFKFPNRPYIHTLEDFKGKDGHVRHKNVPFLIVPARH